MTVWVCGNVESSNLIYIKAQHEPLMFQAPEILLFFSAAIHHLSRKEIAAAGRGDFR